MATFTPEFVASLKSMSTADAAKALEAMMAEQAANSVPAGSVRLAVGPSGMVCLYFGPGSPITLSDARLRQILSDGSMARNDDGSHTFTPKALIKNHPIIAWLNSKPTTTYPAKEAGTFRGRITKARPAYTAELGKDKRKELGLLDD